MRSHANVVDGEKLTRHVFICPMVPDFRGHALRYEGVSALQWYVRRILRSLDILFAVGLGAFVVLVDVFISSTLATAHPILARASWIGACMGLVYTAADIAEDLKLASILDRA